MRKARLSTSTREPRRPGFAEVDDGRTISVPLTWFPKLAGATDEERRDWRLIGAGEGIHWPALDEDVSIAALLRGS